MFMSGELTNARDLENAEANPGENPDSNADNSDDERAENEPTTYVRSTGIFITIPSVSYTAPSD
jgi:hypothetical protein